MPEITEEALQLLLNTGKELSKPNTFTAKDGMEWLLTPQGTLVSITPREYTQLAERPIRIEQAVKVGDAASFLTYHALYSDENSRAFADRDTNSVRAVLDYHKSDDKTARFGKHTLTLMLRHTEEWQKWTKKNGQSMEQAEFAEFLEENAPDIVEPSAAAMLEMATTLQATTDVQFKKAINLQSGEVQLRYEENINGKFGKGDTTIPRSFKISISVYDGQDPVQIEAMFRFRIRGEKLSIWYQLLHLDRWKREAFNAVVKEIAAGGASVFNGSL